MLRCSPAFTLWTVKMAAVVTLQRIFFCLKTMHLLILLFAPLVCGDRIVLTNNGPVRGKSLAPMKVEAFLGIPYAEPPVGPLRFARPIPTSSWQETYDATELHPACVQAVLESFIPQSNMSEDCLYLNLWIPEGGGGRLKPVMVFIHGGSFMLQSANLPLYDGAKLSDHGGVIVASINYRVGSLGFFSGFIEEANGNMGMYDQIMAIRWIKDNARHFGGDPDNIVLFGESAGAFSISLHTISPLSKGLFKRGILQSGSAFHPMMSDDNEVLLRGCGAIAHTTGCADSVEALRLDPEAVVECMKNLPPEKLSEADLQYLRSGHLIPRVGDDFLPKNPIDMIREGEFEDSELLLGVTRNEGSLLLNVYRQDMFGFFGDRVSPGDFNETSAMQFLQSMLKVEGISGIIQKYLDKAKRSRRYTYLHAMSDVVGDYLITCGSVFEADFKSQANNPVYFYRLDYRSPSSRFAEWVGVTHTEELPYVFGNAMFHELDEFEEGLSRHIMDMWVAFAETGNPSVAGGLAWPRYTYGGGKYFIIGRKDRVCRRPDNNRCRLWRSVFRSHVSF